MAGRLEGDLVLYGRGDPTWSDRCFSVDTTSAESCQRDPAAPLGRLVGELLRRGVVEIAGNVIGDGSYFEPVLVHPGWENDDLVFAYAAPVSGLGYNENALDAAVAPAPTPGAPALVRLEGDLGSFEVLNRVVTTIEAGGRLDWSRLPGTRRFVVQGKIRLGSNPRRYELAVDDPNWFAARALTKVLEDSGIVVRGRPWGTSDSLVTLAARQTKPLAEIESRPLRDWVFPILNVSQNWYAEMLLKQLGRLGGTEGSWRQGIEVERRFLIDVVGADSTQFALRDGSGLAAKNLVSPLTFARLLQFMRRQPSFAAFAAGIPKSGELGSLRDRFVKTPLESRVRAKTGSIGQVNTLSGYIDADSSAASLRALHCRVFSIQANHHTLRGQAMIEAIDSVIVEIGKGMRCR